MGRAHEAESGTGNEAEGGVALGGRCGSGQGQGL